MDVKTAPDTGTAQRNPAPERTASSAIGWTVFFFIALWITFFGAYRLFPYLKNGSDVVFEAKLRTEEQGSIFPQDPSIKRVLIFGNSKILAGFLPERFDRLNADDHRAVASFNSGFPGSDLFLPPLQALCAHGQAPNVLLLTLPWNADPPRRSVFHFILDDHAVIDDLFPFRNFLRDVSAFLMNAPSHGGVRSYYGEARTAEQSVLAARGYYLITEQSRFADGRLPDDFHLASDTPSKVVPRQAPPAGMQVAELNRLVRQYHIACYYVPFYLREGEAAPAAPYNQQWAKQIAENTDCQLIGPDYFLYPNGLFADQTHLNQQGARIYTAALYQLLKDDTRALQ